LITGEDQLSIVKPAIKAGRAAGVAGGTASLNPDSDHEGVLIAIGEDFQDNHCFSRCLTLLPDATAGSTPEMHLSGTDRQR
jgi:hypothetical protein